MTEVHQDRQRRYKQTAIWNQLALTCPMCGRHFPALTIRIIRLDGRWHCQTCFDRATHRQTTKPTAITLEQHTDLANQKCATCHTKFGNRRITVNTNGQLVHYRCPRRRNV